MFDVLIPIVGGALTLIVALVGVVWHGADERLKDHEKRINQIERVQGVFCEQIKGIREDVGEIKENVNTLIRR